MNRILIAIFMLALMACKKDDKDNTGGDSNANERPGHIKGMGDVKGLPEGDFLQLPSWLKVEGEIVGCDDAEPSKECQYDGTGGEWMSVRLKFKSTLPNDTSFVMPEGSTIVAGRFGETLLVLATRDPLQKGALLERVFISIPGTNHPSGDSTCSVKLLFYCLNKDKTGSSSEQTYVFGPVLTSPLIKEFIGLLKNKKVKYSDFDGTEPNNFHFGDVTRELQEIIYHITNGDGLTDEDRAYINSLPNK